MERNETGLKLLRQPFPDNLVNQLPKGTKEQNQCPASEKRNCAVCGGWHHPRIRHLSYVGHAAVTDRLLDADPAWNWEPLAFTPEGLPKFDASGGLWIKLTVCGVTRLGYGHAKAKNEENPDPGNREKEVIGDALRNAGMRFGMALDLWHKGDLHADKEETPTAQESAPMIRHQQPVKEALEQGGLLAEDTAMELLARFESAKTLEEVDEINECFKKEWPRIKGVKGLQESMVAIRTNAKLRIKKGAA